jgi:hypothetical protein
MLGNGIRLAAIGFIQRGILFQSEYKETSGNTLGKTGLKKAAMILESV